MIMRPADPDRQNRIRQHRHGDTDPAAITRRQAQQCAAIIAAYQRGHTGYANALDDVAEFLISAGLLGTNTDPDALHRMTQLWADVDVWPIPQPGAPRPQPD